MQLIHALSNNENRTSLAFEMGELSIIEYDISSFSIPHPHFEPEMEMKMVEFFFGLVCLITRRMEHIMHQT
jgi:hypothetical protein